MTFKKRLITAIATGAVLVNALAPIALADSITVTGNGADTHSNVNVSSNDTTNINQTNSANITNNVSSNASTGGNSSSFNTGGNTTINTGNANNTVNVTNAANANQATVGCSTCNNGGVNVTVGGDTKALGNGADSHNNVDVNNSNGTWLNQTNTANFNNNVNATSSTGGNDSKFNTGRGNDIVTGNATTNVTVANAGNINLATVGGSNSSSDPSSVTIAGNGAFSGNHVDLDQNSAVVLDQSNAANIKNDVHANAKTGNNTEKFNTGGDGSITTGDATTNVSVSNAANFNAADLDCGCLLSGLDVTVAKNGDKSWNNVDADSNNSVNPTQVNAAGLYNDVYGNGKSGDNSVSFSTGSVFGDPSVVTGDGTSSTTVNNAGNANVLDSGHTATLPGNWNVGVNFDLGGLWAFLNGFTA